MTVYARAAKISVVVLVVCAAVGSRDLRPAEPVSEPLKTVEWAGDLLDCVLPLKRAAEPGRLWAVAVRIEPPSEPEWLFTLVREQDGTVSAEIREPDGYQVASRFDGLESKSEHLTCAYAVTQLPIKTTRLTTAECPVLPRLADRFERVSWKARPEPDVYIHAILHSGRIQGLLDDVWYTIQRPRGARERELHPIVRWAEAAHAAISRDCLRTASQEPANAPSPGR
jgi:hypothetical protein